MDNYPNNNYPNIDIGSEGVVRGLLEQMAESLSGPSGINEFLSEEGKKISSLASLIDGRNGRIQELKDSLTELHSPGGRGEFLEVKNFDGYNSLKFMHDIGIVLDKAFSEPLSTIESIASVARKTERVFGGWNRAGRGRGYGNPITNINDISKFVHSSYQHIGEAIVRGIVPFEDMVKVIYKLALHQYKYLQKRFLNIGEEKTRQFKAPWETDNDDMGLSNVPYVKTELVKDSALLTDLLLDIVENLPKEYIRKIKSASTVGKSAAGKNESKKTYKGTSSARDSAGGHARGHAGGSAGKNGKTSEIKYVDQFELERAARILVELSNPALQEYIKSPGAFLAKVCESIQSYYDIFSTFEKPMRDIIKSARETPMGVFEISGKDFDRGMMEPGSMLGRIQSINYNGVMPYEDDVRPSGQVEREYFAARRKLMNHLSDSIDKIKASNPHERYDIALAAIKKAIKLNEEAKKAQQTRATIQLKKDEKSENEFYTGVSGQHGEFSFERSPAPKTRLSDVHGKSFDAMKQHLQDLAEYSKMMYVYEASAPRGKIKSNMIAIGPYGCGKTEMARAIAGDPRFIGALVSVQDLLTCMFGEFEKNVNRLWDSARELRQKSGHRKLVFLLMDEFDSWFSGSNGHWVDHTYRRVQKAIQTKLDGVLEYEGVIAVGLTNEPERVPLAIYRRCKYIDIVGELELDERIGLLKHFLTAGMPLSRGFSESDYKNWGELLEGATGDVIGKVTDDIHYELMRKLISEHPKEARELNDYLRKEAISGKELDRKYTKKMIGAHVLVTPEWVDTTVKQKLANPIIREQITTAKRVYSEARSILAKLHDDENPKNQHGNTPQRECATPEQYFRRDLN